MSADNWTTCPKCKKAAAAAKYAAQEKAAQAYGKLPPDQWQELAREAERMPIEPGSTFREDYKIGITAHDTFVVSYGGSCTACGFSHRYEHEEALKV